MSVRLPVQNCKWGKVLADPATSSFNRDLVVAATAWPQATGRPHSCPRRGSNYLPRSRRARPRTRPFVRVALPRGSRGHDTSEFACDNVFRWWQTFGRVWYPRADSILLLCDCGGSNDYRRYVFKEQLQRLAERLQLEVRVAHYPPYTSKYNPVEHRLFPHVTRACPHS